jgi:hypothetical protein
MKHFDPLHALLCIALVLPAIGSTCDKTSSPAPLEPDRAGDEIRIPASTAIVRQGSGYLEWTSEHYGRVYVYDVQSRSVLFNQIVQKGDVIGVSPKESKVFINGKTEGRQPMRKDNNHRIYFDRDDRQGRSADRGSGGGRPQPQHPQPEVEGHPGIPGRATEIGRLEGKSEFTWFASGNGTAYVYSVTEKRVAFRTTLNRNQRLVVRPDARQVLVDGKVVSTNQIGRNQQFKIFFLAN